MLQMSRSLLRSNWVDVCSFPRKQLENVYTKVILPLVSYGLVVWGLCCKTHFSNLKILHTRAGRIVYGLSWNTSTAEVLTQTRWDGLERMYKLRLAEFTFKCINGYYTTEFKDLLKSSATQDEKVVGMEKLFSQAQRQILWGTTTNKEEQQLGTTYPAKNQNNSNNFN